ncbi:MFS transporter [Pseudomonas mohnii]
MTTTFQVEAPLSDRAVLALSAACGFAVATLYYSQPLLPSIASDFGGATYAQGAIAMLTQLGYALGLLLFGPLGDRLDRRQMITALLLANMLGAVFCASSANLPWLLLSSALLGLTAVSAQIIIPAVSGLADPARRGHTVGRLMSGLFAGTLLARTVSGYVGAHAGWRTMFVIAAVLDVFLIVLVWLSLPASRPTTDLTYPHLLASLGQLFMQQRLLREACLSGFMLFAAFNVLWGALAILLLKQPYGYGSDVAGLFGLVGIVGMFSSASIGRLTDRYGGRRVVVSAALLIIVAFIFIAGSAYGLWALIAGVVVLDLGSRANLVANQTRLYTSLPHARGRLNTVFMTCYFLGGAVGSTVGTLAANHYGWPGVAAAGALCALFTLMGISGFRAKERRRSLEAL